MGTVKGEPAPDGRQVPRRRGAGWAPGAGFRGGAVRREATGTAGATRASPAAGSRQQTPATGGHRQRVPRERREHRQQASPGNKRAPAAGAPILSPRVCLSYSPITETNPWGKIAAATLGVRRHRLRARGAGTDCGHGTSTKTCRPRARGLQAARQRGDNLTVGSVYAVAPAAADVETLSSSHAHLGIGRTSWNTMAAAKAMATTVHTLNTPVASR